MKSTILSYFREVRNLPIPSGIREILDSNPYVMNNPVCSTSGSCNLMSFAYKGLEVLFEWNPENNGFAVYCYIKNAARVCDRGSLLQFLNSLNYIAEASHFIMDNGDIGVMKRAYSPQSQLNKSLFNNMMMGVFFDTDIIVNEIFSNK